MADKIFPVGLRTFAKRENAPDFVLGTLVVDVDAFTAWLNGEAMKYATDYKGAKQVKFSISTNKSDGRVNFSVDTYGLEQKNESMPTLKERATLEDLNPPPDINSELPF